VPRLRRFVLPAVASAVTVTALLQTLVVPVLGVLGHQLHASPSAVGWVVTANLLAAAVLTPLLGRLGDLFGRKRVLLAILSAVAVGSLLAATTTSLGLLIGARVLQGAAFGLFPLSIGVVRDELPAARVTGAMAIVSGTLGAGGGIGLVLAGLVTTRGGDYHRVFWLALGICLAALLVTAVVVPDRVPRTGGRVDWLGAAVLGVGLVLLLLPLSQGHEWGWGSLRTIGLLLASTLVLAAWLRVEARVASPLIAPSLMRNRPLLVTNAAGVCVGIAFFPTRLGYGFSASVLSAAAVYLLPGALLGVLAAPGGGRLVNRFGAPVTLALAGGAGAVGFLLMALLHDASWQIITGSLLVNGSVSLAFAAMPALIVAEVSPAETGVANSVNSICRSTGSALASALVVTLLASDVLPSGVPAPSAYAVAFGVGAAAMLGVVLLALFGLPRLRRPSAHEAETERAMCRTGQWAVAGAR
jgi:MFS family permease